MKNISLSIIAISLGILSTSIYAEQHNGPSAANLFNEMDTDNSGTVTQSEYNNFKPGPPPGMNSNQSNGGDMPPPPQDNNNMSNNSRQPPKIPDFESVDTDGNGIIDLAEFKNSCRNH